MDDLAWLFMGTFMVPRGPSHLTSLILRPSRQHQHEAHICGSGWNVSAALDGWMDAHPADMFPFMNCNNVDAFICPIVYDQVPAKLTSCMYISTVFVSISILLKALLWQCSLAELLAWQSLSKLQSLVWLYVKWSLRLFWFWIFFSFPSVYLCKWTWASPTSTCTAEGPSPPDEWGVQSYVLPIVACHQLSLHPMWRAANLGLPPALCKHTVTGDVPWRTRWHSVQLSRSCNQASRKRQAPTHYTLRYFPYLVLGPSRSCLKYGLTAHSTAACAHPSSFPESPA